MIWSYLLKQSDIILINIILEIIYMYFTTVNYYHVILSETCSSKKQYYVKTQIIEYKKKWDEFCSVDHAAETAYIILRKAYFNNNDLNNSNNKIL